MPTLEAARALLAATGLDALWNQREQTVLLGTHLGDRTGFLATWAAFRASAPARARLHFLALDTTAERLGPTRLPDELRPLQAELEPQLRPALDGFHRLHLDQGRVLFTLLRGPAVATLPLLQARVDAFLLEANTADIGWDTVAREFARLASPGAVAVTALPAAAAALAGAGFTTEQSPAGPERAARLRFPGRPASPLRSAPRTALVIGAGLAGSSCAERLAARGWQVTVLERRGEAAAEASGNPSGLLAPILNAAPTPNSRLSHAACLYAARHLAALAREGSAVSFRAGAVLRLARDAKQGKRFQEIIRSHRLPEDFLHWVDAAQASALAGYALQAPGCWFAQGCWVDPASLVRANLTRWGSRIDLALDVTVADLQRRQDNWLALDGRGQVLGEANTVILAAGTGTAALAGAATLPLTAVRGQVSLLPEARGRQLRLAVSGNGFIAPLLGAGHFVGATFQTGDMDPEVRLADHQENLDRAERLLPGFTAGIDAATLQGRVAWRAATPDRLPLAGRLEGLGSHAWVLAGLGARGLSWAPLGAELLAAQINDEPLPVASDIVDALAPGRFIGRTPQATAEE